MWPTSRFERLEHDLACETNGCMEDDRVTFGILIADARQGQAKEYIINYMDELDKESNNYFNFYIPGYTDDKFWGKDDSCYLEINRRRYYFNEEDFKNFCDELYNKFAIKYTNNPMLVLVSMVPGNYKTKKYIIIELDKNEQYTINRSRELFSIIFKAANTKVDLEGVRREIIREYINGNLLEIIQSLFDKTIFIKMVKMFKTYKIYRIE